MIKVKGYLNGKWIESGLDFVNVISPETNKVIGQFPSMNPSDIDRAFVAAHSTQPEWANIPKVARISLLKKWANLINDHQDEIAGVMVQEIAKNYKSCLSEIVRSVDYIYETITTYLEQKPIIISKSLVPSNKEVVVSRKPLGVIVVIAPFNYPINLAITKLAPALLTGNTVVYKSPTNGTLSSAILVKLAVEAGFPPGVLNFVTGRGRVISDHLAQNKYIDGLMFTGGTETGLSLAKKTGKIHLLLELGGKDPAIVLEDADLDLAVTRIIKGAFSFSGQRCTAIKRVLVNEKIKDAFLLKLTNAVKKLTVGLAKDNCEITALINSSSADYVDSLIDDAVQKGAKILTSRQRENNLLWPVVISDVTLNMKIAWEEQFGPALPIISFTSLEKAIKITNDSEYGLQASIFSSNIEKILKIAQKINVGAVNINGESQRGPDSLPFTGVKDSGLGTQGVKYALEAVTHDFSIVLNR